MKIRISHARLAVLPLALVPVFSSFSQTLNQTAETTIKETLVTATRFADTASDLPFGVSVISSDEIKRSGAGTVAELLALTKPSVLVPLPSSAAGHQEENARVLSDKGAAILLQESPAFQAELSFCLETLIKEPEKIHGMKINFKLVQAPPAFKAVKKLKALIEKIALQKS